MDEATGVFIDPTKVKAIHFEGKYYKTRGPLNVPRSPQGKPVFVAPGGSTRGRKFSGRNAEVVLAGGATPADMKDYRDEVLRSAVAYGRDPKTVKTMFTCMPTIVQSKSDVEPMKEMIQKGKESRMEHGLAAMSFLSGIDFSKFDLDAPVGEIKTNGMQTMLKSFGNPNDSLRQIMNRPNEFTTMVGTADGIAGLMQETMEEVGGDGFLIAGQFKPKYVTSIVDELVPALQKRQLTRTEYGYDHFRDNLMAF
jgi:alkanesulfonate monooxygenase SsuD/methylene tetrahydromethanopterin reductase-like flavin-dependent oxidoreductase (luciferase family)